MLNYLLGFPRHVWLSPFELHQNPGRCNKKMNAAIDLTNATDNSGQMASNGVVQTESVKPAERSDNGQQQMPSANSASNTSSSPFPNSQNGESGNTPNNAPTVLTATTFPDMVTQAIQSIATASANAVRTNTMASNSQQQLPRGSGKYQCRVCNLVFLNKSGVQLHAKEAHRDELKPYQCQQCIKSFSSPHQLAQHNRIHTGEKPYKCTFCDRGFKQLSHLQKHLRLHIGERPYKCTVPECGRSFVQLSNLNQHLRNHENHLKKPYHCDVCGKGFVAEVSLMTHMTTQHSMVVGQGLYPCSVCHNMFATRDSLLQHMHHKH